MDYEYRKYLSPWDYVVFSIALVVSAGIGVFFGCIKKQKDNKEFLTGNRQMGVLPVSLSTLASFMSAITLLGTPAEIYSYGAVYIWIAIGYAFTIIATVFIYLPVFYPLQLTTSYQYLGKRFHPAVQVLGAIVFLIQMIIYLGIVLYAPSLALEAVTGLNVWISVSVLVVVCTFYTAIGGIKAVMWTDVFQICIMVTGLSVVVIRGLTLVPIQQMFNIAYENGRLNFFEIDPNPTVRHTIWSLAIGGIFTWTGIYGINQTMVQRMVSTKSLRDARAAAWVNLPGLIFFMLVCSFCGIVVFSLYYNCDPVLTKVISSYDQLLPLFVMTFANWPGVPGLFVACLFSGALSTVSSGVNSLAAVTMKDMIQLRGKTFTNKVEINITKLLGVLYGLLSLAMAFVASQLGPVLTAALALFGMMSGPILGVFTLGMTVPFANWKGALIGHLISQAVTFWIGFGYYVFNVKNPNLGYSTSGCNFNTTTTAASSTTQGPTITTSPTPEPYIFPVYKISYMWYSLIGFFVAYILGMFISLCSGGESSERRQKKYFAPFARYLCRKYMTEDFAMDEFAVYEYEEKSNIKLSHVYQNQAYNVESKY